MQKSFLKIQIFVYQYLVSNLGIGLVICSKIMAQKIQQKEDELEASQDMQDLQPLKQAISPRKLSKDFKALVMNASSNKGRLKLSLLEDYQRQSKFAQHAKKSTIIPVLLFQLFTQNNLIVTFSSRSNVNEKSEESTKKSNNTQKTSNQTTQQLKEQFFKDKKNKSLLALIQSKIQEEALNKKRDKQKYMKQGVDFSIGKLSITIDHTEQESLISLFDMLSLFFCILSSLIRNWSIKIDTFEIALNTKNCKSPVMQGKSSEVFPLNLWKFLIEVKNIENIEIKLPKIRDFFDHIKLIRETTKLKESDEKDEYLFSHLYRVQIEDIMKEQGNKQLNLGFLSYFLQNAPKLKVFMYSVDFCDQNKNENQFMTYRNSFELFKTISESNNFIENIIFHKIKLTYQQIPEEKPQQKQKESQEKQLYEQAQLLDQNLHWIKNMQQNCPYLTGFTAEFEKKTPYEERRLPERVRNQYIQNLKTTKEIMNLFHKRSMNAQTYFNCIKIMEKQGFDYQTILGVLDKISPFAPF